MVSSIQQQHVSRRRDVRASYRSRRSRSADGATLSLGKTWASLNAGAGTALVPSTVSGAAVRSVFPPSNRSSEPRQVARPSSRAVRSPAPPLFSRFRALTRAWVQAGPSRAAAIHIDTAFQVQSMILLVAAASALLLLKPALSPDSALMRLALPTVSVSLPVSNGIDAVLTTIPSISGDIESGLEPAPVDLGRFQRLQIREYRIAPGDTLSGIAQRNGLRIDTLASLNQISDARRIRVGDTFRIPNRDGILHTVARGESLSAIASRYNTGVNALLDANDLTSSSLAVGQTLFVPDARMNRNDLQRVLGELFIYPVVNARFTSGFGMRNDPFTGIRRFHNGIDLAGPIGMPVRAARAGRVVHVENQVGNYGKFVIIRHDGGYQTLYAHLDSFSVRVGQNVNQGQQIGALGNTGRSTGPHVHFSVIRNGTFVDPMRYLQ